jgi:hypothetical protein
MGLFYNAVSIVSVAYTEMNIMNKATETYRFLAGTSEFLYF